MRGQNRIKPSVWKSVMGSLAVVIQGKTSLDLLDLANFSKLGLLLAVTLAALFIAVRANGRNPSHFPIKRLKLFLDVVI